MNANPNQNQPGSQADRERVVTQDHDVSREVIKPDPITEADFRYRAMFSTTNWPDKSFPSYRERFDTDGGTLDLGVKNDLTDNFFAVRLYGKYELNDG